MAGMTDLVMMLLVLGAGYYAWTNGMLDQIVEQVKGMGGGAAPTEEAAPAPAEEAAPTEAEPAADTPTEAEPAPADDKAADSGGGGGEDDKAAEDKPAEDDKKKKKSEYAIHSTYYTVPMNWK